MSLSLTTDSNNHAFEAEEARILIEQSRIGNWLMLILIPVGITLDYFVYPERILEFTTYRMVALLPVVAALVLGSGSIGKQFPRLVIGLWVGAAIIMICVMIYSSDGTRSSYYDGLVLTILAVGILLPMKVVDVVALSLATIALYSVSCLAHGSATFDAAAFFNASYFLSLAAIIATTAVHFAAMRRRREFNLRNEIEDRNRKLQELDQMKSRFFANVSHELRTPLTLILAPIQELLLRTNLDHSLFDALKTVEASALRLLRLVNDLLELVRFDQADVSVTKVPVALDVLLKSLTEQSKYLAQSKGISLSIAMPDAAVVVLGDDADFERIFINLIGNAVKFTDPGGSINISLDVEVDDVVVRVRDTGIGIAQDDLVRIFERFQQVGDCTTSRHQGLGLGLALVKELVARHGGRIDVESVVGGGTTMIVRLPLCAGDELECSTRSPITPRPAEGVHRDVAIGRLPPASMTVDPSAPTASADAPVVLVVDDEPEIRRFLSSMLSREFSVIGASDGVQALRMIEEKRPSIVLLDLMLPEVDGLEVCRRVKGDQDLRSTKVLLLTARIDEEAKLEALANGADDFLTKPFSSVEVKTRVRNLLRSAQLEEDLRKHNQELRETLRRLREAEAQLLQREKLSALGTMAAGLLHEMNNPLSYMGVAVDLACRSPKVLSDPQLNEIMIDVQDGLKRVQSIVTDLRTFATSRPLEHFQPFNVAAMVRQALRFTATELSRCTVSINVPEDLKANGVEQQLSQVLVNLLVNASRAVAKAADRAGLVEVSAEAFEGRVRIRVSDNGIGIEPELISRIFDPFYTTSEVGEGMGLGLSVSHSIVERHSGTLCVTSQKNVGTTFTFDIEHHIPQSRQRRTHVSSNQQQLVDPVR